MRLTGIGIKGYRSVRGIRFPVGPLTVFVGRNGVGKTNLYRGLALLRAAATGTITREIALEGGMTSVLWAGPVPKTDRRRLILTADFDEFSYTIELGMPQLSPGYVHPVRGALVVSEPQVKAERIALVANGRHVVLMERSGGTVWLRDETGRRHTYEDALLSSETALASFRDGARFAELAAVREAILDWRLYHEFRTDAEAPVRKPCLAIVTPTLSADGHDLATVLGTLVRVREDTAGIAAAIEDAFPGASFDLSWGDIHCGLTMTFPELRRSFDAQELSDGTLKYLCLLGALCGYRMPGFVALNEPEASLHPDLIAPLARLIARATDRARVWVVTHSEALGAELGRLMDVPPLPVVKVEGETRIEGLMPDGSFADEDD